MHEAIDGSNLNLTIDENVQSIVEEYLTEAMSTFTVHGRGSAIVMNVKTGAILAMASLEQFDPNDPKTITDPKMNEILAKTEIDAEDIDWLESRLARRPSRTSLQTESSAMKRRRTRRARRSPARLLSCRV